MLSLSIADQYHLEICVDLDMQLRSAEWKMYLFFPTFMANDSDTFGEGQFHPNLLQQQQLSKAISRSKSDIQSQINQLKGLIKNSDKTNNPAFFTALADVMNDLFQQFSKAPQDELIKLEKLVDQIHEFAEQSPQGKKRRYTKLACQLLSYQYCQALLKIKKRTKTTQLDLLINRLTLRAEQQNYRLTHDTEGGRERLLDKHEVTKRIINSPYLLKRKRLRSGKVAQQLIFGLAAAVAMAFATGIAFATQRSFGNFSTPFFFSLVLSYIFKDRIKELGRNYLVDEYFKHFFQSHHRLYSKYSAKPVMDIRESFFRTNSGKLDEKTAKKRVYFSELGSTGVDGVSIFHRHYQPHKIPTDDPINKFKDKLTINLSKRLRALPGLSRNHFKQTDHGIEAVNVYRVQPLYVIIELKQDKVPSTLLYKLITSRKGIHRLEAIQQNSNE